ncbi:hypothetical protein [Cellulomonas sp. URHD0024]|uniref:hypothetical protein n=1 Tax=Cellulomonas sp. URHD0024 TaxID=1302620 RepID=UPI0003F50E7E|nr:hypothetical protein [Cellulomonas sp. URHD0024]
MVPARQARALLGWPLVTFACWLAAVAYAVLPLASSLLDRTVFLGSDVLLGFAPWRGTGATEPAVANRWVGDTLDAAVPTTTLLSDAVRQGHLLTWNAFVSGGTPLGSVPDSGLANPLSWPWLLFPARYAPGVVQLVVVAVAIAGTALLLRRYGLPSAAQAVGGLVFASTGFMVAWTSWPQVRVAALLPWLFWAVDRLVMNRRVRDGVPVALVLAAMLLGGFHAVTAWAVMAVVPYAVVRCAMARSTVRAWLHVTTIGVGAGIVGFALAGFQVVPFALQAVGVIDFDVRRQTADAHLTLPTFATTVVPGALGWPDDLAWDWEGAGWNPVERFAFLGVAAVVLVLVGLLVRPRTVRAPDAHAFALAGAAVCVVLIFGVGPFLGWAQHLPVFSTNIVTRLRSLLGLFVAISAAFGMAALLAPAGLRVQLRDTVGGRAIVGAASRVAVVVLVAAGTALAVRRALAVTPAASAGAARTEALVALVAGALVLGAAVVVWARPRPGAVVAVLVVVPVVLGAQALDVTRHWWPTSSVDTFYPVTDTHRFLDANLGHERYGAVGKAMFGAGAMYEQRAVAGHAFHTPGWKRMLTAAAPDAMLSPTYSSLTVPSLSSPALDRLATRYAVADPRDEVPGVVTASGAPAGTTTLDAATSVETAVTGPLRGARLALTVDHGDAVEVRVEVRGPDGAARARATTTVTPASAGLGVWVALDADDVDADAERTIALSVVGPGAVTVPTDADGDWVVDVVRPTADGLNVADTGSATVYERTNALPRFRWASRAVVETDEDARVTLLAGGTVPDDTVVLEHPDQAATASATSSGHGEVQVLADRGDSLALSVDADGPGWLVVADALRPGGWHAEVDGVPAELLDADEALSAIRVDAGTHEVSLQYDPPGMRAGWLLTASGWLVVLLVVGGAAVRDRRSRRRSVTT